ncbi:MAG TPA: bifunctional homocysteine S-methyltransferase/methylenetetrahydrofolate reductase [Gemmatimonadota bacterium]|nr:bifunctional homocysteine S-methyltransferase/methylenetetrahydrofolate reductase [Gemmatimonadota bacterium]
MSADRLRELIGDGGVHLMDGAIGTVLYQRGVFVNVCYDELNLTEPDLVLGVHADYVRAGSELIETNTFGANPVKLSSFGLDDRTEEINETAARLAVQAAQGRAVVLGSIGPLGIRIEPWGPTAIDEAVDFFARQAVGLAAGGVDGFILETFADVAELEAALRAVRRVAPDRPVFAQMSFGEEGTSAYGTTVEQMARSMSETDADILGLNCSVGPSATLDAVERLVNIADRPVSALPNAGLPRTVADRKIYLASPEYVARYARRMADAGARFLGGCCGTTAEHIRHMAAHLETAGSPGQRRTGRGVPPRPGGSRADGLAGESDDGAASGTVAAAEGSVVPASLAERSALGRRLASGDFVRGIELMPPRGWEPGALVASARMAREGGFNTVHLLDSSARYSRMSPIAAAIVIEREAGIEAVPHYTCRDRNMLGMVGDLLGAASAGLRNLLLVTGDPPRGGPYDTGGVFDIDSIGLTNVVRELNAGRDPGGESIGVPTRFVTGVALNPSAVDPDDEIRRFMWKADAGADYAVTQPVYDADAFLRFLDRIERFGVPILAGLLPPLSLRNAEYLANEVPGLSVPRRVIDRMHHAAERGPDAEAEEGVAIAAEVFEAIRDRVAGVVVSCPGNRVERAVPVVA